jgi:hypothetical protein
MNTLVEQDLEIAPVDQRVRNMEQALIEEARQRQRQRHFWLAASLIIAASQRGEPTAYQQKRCWFGRRRDR